MARNKYMDLNPQSISEMDPKEVRKAYSELRSIARKRADRLEAAGFEARRFDPVNKVDPNDMDEQLAELAYFLQSPGSSVKVARQEKEQASLLARGYNISNIDKFGNFMEEMRQRYKNRMYRDSDPFAKIYEASERRGIPISTIKKEFGKWLRSEEDAKKLRTQLEDLPLASKEEFTSDKLKDLMSARYGQPEMYRKHLNTNKKDKEEPKQKKQTKPNKQTKTKRKSRKK